MDSYWEVTKTQLIRSMTAFEPQSLIPCPVILLQSHKQTNPGPMHHFFNRPDILMLWSLLKPWAISYLYSYWNVTLSMLYQHTYKVISIVHTHSNDSFWVSDFYLFNASPMSLILNHIVSYVCVYIHISSWRISSFIPLEQRLSSQCLAEN